MGGVRGGTSVEICGTHAKWRVEIRMSRSHPKHYTSLYPQNGGELGSEWGRTKGECERSHSQSEVFRIERCDMLSL
jgi:hypothetical protein